MNLNSFAKFDEKDKTQAKRKNPLLDDTQPSREKRKNPLLDDMSRDTEAAENTTSATSASKPIIRRGNWSDSGEATKSELVLSKMQDMEKDKAQESPKNTPNTVPGKPAEVISSKNLFDSIIDDINYYNARGADALVSWNNDFNALGEAAFEGLANLFSPSHPTLKQYSQESIPDKKVDLGDSFKEAVASGPFSPNNKKFVDDIGASVKEATRLFASGYAESMDKYADENVNAKIAEQTAKKYPTQNANPFTKGIGDVVAAVDYMLPSMAISASGGAGAQVAGTLLTGVMSMPSAYAEARNEGASQEEALTYSGLEFVNNFVGENLIGGFLGKSAGWAGKGIDLVSKGKFSALYNKMIDGLGKTPIIKSLAKATIRNAGEGMEEVVQSLFSTLNKRMTYDADAKIDMGEAAYEGVIGFFMSAVIGSGDFISSVPVYKSDFETVNSFSKLAAEATTAGELAQIRNLGNSIINAAQETISDYESGNSGTLTDRMKRSITEDADADTESNKDIRERMNYIIEGISSVLTTLDGDTDAVLSNLKRIRESKLTYKVSKSVLDYKATNLIRKGLNEVSGNQFVLPTAEEDAGKARAANQQSENTTVDTESISIDDINSLTLTFAQQEVKKAATETQIEQAKAFREAFGWEVRLYSKEASNGKIENSYLQGQTFYVNVKAAKTVPAALGHELMHAIEKTSAYKELTALVSARLSAEGKSIDSLISEAQDRWGDVYNGDVSSNKAMQEVVADYVGDNILNNVDALVDVAKKSPQLWSGIKYYVNRAIAKLTDTGYRSVVKEAKQILANIEKADKTAKAYYAKNRATQNVSRPAQDTQANNREESSGTARGTETREKAPDSDKITENEVEERNREITSSEGFDASTRVYSISYTTDNRPVVVVNDDILKGARNTNEEIDRVKASLRRFKRVPISGQSIYFTSDTAKEFTNSRYTQKVKKTNRVVFEDKMRLGAHPQDIIYATTDYINEAPNHPRKDNIVDFARGKILFDISGNKYEGSVVIGFTKSGICLLHDIVGINSSVFDYKKEAATVKGMDSDSESTRPAATSSDTSILTSDGKINTDSSDVTEMSQSERRSSMSRIDAEYMSLAENYKNLSKEEKARVLPRLEEMVKEAAERFGYNSPLLYHGTRSFGFTKFDLSKMDDKMSIFATSNERIASTYSAGGGKKEIYAPLNQNLGGVPLMKIEKELESIYGNPRDTFVSYLDPQATINEMISYVNEEAKECADDIRDIIDVPPEDLLGRESDDEYTYIQTKEKLSYLADMLESGSYKQISTAISETIEYLIEFISEYDPAGLNDYIQGIPNAVFCTKQNADALILLEGKDISNGAFLVSAKDDRYSFYIQSSFETIEALTVDDARKKLEEAGIELEGWENGIYDDRGLLRGNIYSLYAKLGKSLVIDSNYSHWGGIDNWRSALDYNLQNTEVYQDGDKYILLDEDENILLEVNSEHIPDYYSIHRYLLDEINNTLYEGIRINTRELSRIAKRKGYNSVVIKNLYDNGGGNPRVGYEEAADIYIIFDPANIKSADPVTYDDNGNVIPLSERFNDENDDIRWSVSEVDSDGDFSKIKEQIKAASDELNAMDAVCDITVPENLNTNSKALAWIVDELNLRNSNEIPIDRYGYGKCYISKKAIHDGVRYCKTNEERAALAAVSKVIKRGIVIEEHDNHKGREKQTITFGAPVILNGTRGNMAVVLNRNGNRYYAHRILLPDGSAFVFEKQKNTAAEGNQGVTRNGSLAGRTDAVSDTIIYTPDGKVNTDSLDVTEMSQSERRSSVSRTDEDKSAVIDQLRNYLDGKITRDELNSSIDAIDNRRRGASNNTSAKLSEAQQLVRDAHSQQMSVEEYLEENAELYDNDGRWNKTAREALRLEESGYDNKRYSISPVLMDDFEKVLAGTFESDKGEIYIGETSNFLVEEIEADSLPVTMPSNKAYSAMVTEDEAKADGKWRSGVNYHGLGKDGLYNALVASENPVAVFVDNDTDMENRGDRLVIVTDYKKEGVPVAVIQKFETNGRLENKNITTNKDITVYEREKLLGDILDARNDRTLLYLDKKRSQKLFAGQPGANYLAAIRTADFKDSIRNFWGNVKWLNEKSFSISRQSPYSLPEDLERAYDGLLPKADEATDALSVLNSKARAYYRKNVEKPMRNKIKEAFRLPYSVPSEAYTTLARMISNRYTEGGEFSESELDEIFEYTYAHAYDDAVDFVESTKEAGKLRGTTLTLTEEEAAAFSEEDPAERYSDFFNFGEGGISIAEAYETMKKAAPGKISAATGAKNQLKKMVSLLIARYNAGNMAMRKTDKAFDAIIKADFKNAVTDQYAELATVKRYVEDKKLNDPVDAPINAAEKGEIPTELSDIYEIYKHLDKLRKEYIRAESENLLTSVDKNVVKELLRGDRTVDSLPQNIENREAILAVYEAKKAYNAVADKLFEYKTYVKALRLKEANESLKDLSSFKNKHMISMMREAPHRVFREVGGDAIVEKYYKPITKANADIVHFIEEYNGRIRELGISTNVEKGNTVSESYAVQFIGEAEDNIRQLEKAGDPEATRGGLTLEEWRTAVTEFTAMNPNLNQEKIDRCIKAFHKIYDELFAKLNDTLVRNGYDPVQYRSGYFPHFNDGEGDGGFLSKLEYYFGIDLTDSVLPTAIAGRTETFKPGKQWFSHLLERKGKNTSYDALQGFDKYIAGAANVIFKTDNIQRLRALARQIRYLTSDESIREQIDAIRRDNNRTEQQRESDIQNLLENGRYALSDFVQWLDEYTNIYAGKKSFLDRSQEKVFRRKSLSLVKSFQRRVASNMVGGNIASAVTNFIPLNQAASVVGTRNILKAMVDQIRSAQMDADSVFMVSRGGYDTLYRSAMQKFSDVLATPMELIDGFTTGTIVRAAYAYQIKHGMNSTEAMEWADQFAADMMGGRSAGEQPTLFETRNVVLKLFTQFQLEVNNEFSVLFKDIPIYAGKGKKDKWVARAVAMFMRYFIGAWMFNELYEFFFGRRSALDPIDIVNDFVGNVTGKKLPNIGQGLIDAANGEEFFAEQEKKDFVGTVGDLTQSIAEELPFSAVISLIDEDFDGGRLPVSAAVPNVKDITTALSTRQPKKIAYEAIDELSKPLSLLLLPTGGNQLQKTLKGTATLARGGSYKVNNSGEEYLQYAVDPTFGNISRALVLGKSSLPTAREWVDRDFESLTPEQTAAYRAAVRAGDDDGEDIFDTILAVKHFECEDGEKPKEAKTRILFESGLSEDAIASLYTDLIASDKEKEAIESGDISPKLIAGISKEGTSSQKYEYLSGIELTPDEAIGAINYLGSGKMTTEKGEPTTAAKMIAMIESGADPSTVMLHKSDGYNFDKAYSFMEAGVSADESLKLESAIANLEPEKGKSGIFDLQKYEAVMDSGLRGTALIDALSVIMNSSTYNKVLSGNVYGVTPDAYIKALRKCEAYDENSNGKYTQYEIKQMIDKEYSTLSAKKKAVLWQMLTGADSAVNNPYNMSAGEEYLKTLSLE